MTAQEEERMLDEQAVAASPILTEEEGLAYDAAYAAAFEDALYYLSQEPEVAPDNALEMAEDAACEAGLDAVARLRRGKC